MRPQTAAQLMLTVHTRGRAVAGTYPRDIAMSKQRKATDMARREGFPLVITCEPSNNIQ